jgi:hypothetical protein
LKNNNPDGRGVLKLPNGRKYDGEWKDGSFNGRGVLYNESGSVYYGEWEDG